MAAKLSLTTVVREALAHYEARNDCALVALSRLSKGCNHLWAMKHERMHRELAAIIANEITEKIPVIDSPRQAARRAAEGD